MREQIGSFLEILLVSGEEWGALLSSLMAVQGFIRQKHHPTQGVFVRSDGWTCALMFSGEIGMC